MGEWSGSSVTTRIPLGDSGDGEVAVIEPTSLASGVPHLAQKFDDGGLSAPHFAHSVVSALPHCGQKLLAGGLFVPHFEQRIGLPERAK
jgi:hypothetical protein